MKQKLKTIDFKTKIKSR